MLRFMLLDLHTYTSHYAPVRSRAIRRLLFLGGGPLQQIQAGSWKKDKDMEDSQKRREAEAAKAT